MKKYLLFTFILFSFSAKAQSDSVEIVAPKIPDSLVKISSDTVSWGNFYVADLAGSRLAFNSFFNERERLIVGGRYYGRVIGYRTHSDRFLIETGYLIRRISNVNRIPKIVGPDFGYRDFILYYNTRQIPLYLKTLIFRKPYSKFKMRLITGLNFTILNSEEYGIKGDLKVISKESDKIILQDPNPTMSEETYTVYRTQNTNTGGSNKRLTVEIGLEWTYPFSQRFEFGGGVTYQYRKKPFEEIRVDFVGTTSNPAGPIVFERVSTSMGPYKDDSSLNCAIFVRYNFNKIKFGKRPEPERQ